MIRCPSAKAFTVGLGAGVGSPVDATVSVSSIDVEATTAIAAGSRLTSGGDLGVTAETTIETVTQALGGAYEDGSVGIGLAISLLENSV